MEKYFSSTYNSSIASSKNLSSFHSMIALQPNRKPNDQQKSYRTFRDGGLISKNTQFKKQLNKTTITLPSSNRSTYKSVEKNQTPLASSRNINSDLKAKTTTTFLKKKEFLTLKQIGLPSQKQLRETDSTLCQSPKNHFNCGLKMSDFKKIRLIGHGKYGSVFMVKHPKTGFIGAMKIIRKIDIDCLQKKEKQQMINQIIRQIKIQMFLDHPNLVKLYTYFSDSYNIYLLMQLGCDGMLYDIMKKKQKLKQQSVSIISRQILEGMAYMHKQKVIHRDLKPQNIVLIHGLAKICDFGWSVFCSKELRSTFCGTPLYLSPQILKGNLYNEKIDTWAVGTLAYQLYTSENPFKIKKKQDLSKIITDDFVMKTGSFQIREFITFILKKDPTKRPDAQTIKTHSFIRKYRDIETSQEICALVYKKPISIYTSCYK